MADHISLHAAARDEVRRGQNVAEALRRGGRHTRATVAAELERPATGQPPLYAQAVAALEQEGQNRA